MPARIYWDKCEAEAHVPGEMLMTAPAATASRAALMVENFSPSVGPTLTAYGRIRREMVGDS